MTSLHLLKYLIFCFLDRKKKIKKENIKVNNKAWEKDANWNLKIPQMNIIKKDEIKISNKKSQNKKIYSPILKRVSKRRPTSS